MKYGDIIKIPNTGFYQGVVAKIIRITGSGDVGVRLNSSGDGRDENSVIWDNDIVYFDEGIIQMVVGKK
jgi:hypothetical protein